MSSQFDVTVAFLQDVYKQASLDSQKLHAQMRMLRQQLQIMQKSIENKTEGIRREMTPRIQQLEEKMSHSWDSIEQMNRLAQEELDRQRQIFANCQKIVKQMDERIDGVQSKV